MSFVRPLFALALAWAIATAVPAGARELTDITGTRVRLADRPARIVTLAPSLGELAADLVGENLERIVGVTDFTDFPPALKKVRSVGNYAKFNLESVVSLKPDLVLATHDGNSKDQVAHLRELGVPVLVVGTETFSEIEASMKLVAEAIGVPAEGERMVSQFKLGLSRIRERARTRAGARPSVLMQIGGDPLIVVGRKTFLNEALEAVGARNVYGDNDQRYPRPSVEDAVSRNPDHVLVMALGEDMRSFQTMAASWAQFSSMKAVREKKVRILKADALLRPTLRLLEGLSLLEREIHGERSSHGKR